MSSIQSPSLEERDRLIRERVARTEAAMRSALAEPSYPPSSSNHNQNQYSSTYAAQQSSSEDERLLRAQQELASVRAGYVSRESHDRTSQQRYAAMEEARRTEEAEKQAQQRALKQQHAKLQESAEHGQSQGRRRVILIMTVEIGDGRSDQIRVHEGDDPRVLAQEFCSKHALGDHVIDPLTDHIKTNVKNTPQLSPTAKKTEKKDEARDLSARRSPRKSPGRDREREQKEKEQREREQREQREREREQREQREQREREQKEQREREQREQKEQREKEQRERELQKEREQKERERQRQQEEPLPLPPHPVARERSTPAMAARPASAKPVLTHSTSSSSSHGSGHMDSGSGNNTVFDRLHSTSNVHRRKQEEVRARVQQEEEEDLARRRRGMSAVSRTIAVSQGRSSSADTESIGDRLYQDGIRKLELRERVAEQARKEAEVDPEATFRPQISNVARRLHSQSDTWQRVTKNEDRDAARMRLALEEERRRMEECTFRPQLNRKSEMLMAEKERMLKEQHLSHHDNLFLDAERRKMRQQEMEQLVPAEATFRPQIQQSSATRKVQRQREGENFDDFVNRLVYSKAERDAVIAELKQQQLDRKIDPATGQPLFKPRIHTSSSSSGSVLPSSSSHNQNIGEALYASRTELEEHRARLAEREHDRLREMARMAHASEKSQQIVEEKKKKKFAILFSVLDSLDRDGLISADDCNTATLEPVVAREVLYVLHSDPDRRFRYDDFFEALDRRLKSQRIATGTFLSLIQDPLEDKDKVSQPETFRPVINERSNQLAQKKREQHGSGPLHEVLYQDARKAEQKRIEKRRELDELEMKECTFRPQAGGFASGQPLTNLNGSTTSSRS